MTRRTPDFVCEQIFPGVFDIDRSRSERRDERRFQPRGARLRESTQPLKLLGAFVTMRPGGIVAALRRWSRASLVVNDLSRRGLSFTSDGDYRVGEQLELHLHTREWSEPMRLLGDVCWVRSLDADGSSLVGFRFAPFGDAADDNEPAALGAIRRLEWKFAGDTRA